MFFCESWKYKNLCSARTLPSKASRYASIATSSCLSTKPEDLHLYPFFYPISSPSHTVFWHAQRPWSKTSIMWRTFWYSWCGKNLRWKYLFVEKNGKQEICSPTESLGGLFFNLNLNSNCMMNTLFLIEFGSTCIQQQWWQLEWERTGLQSPDSSITLDHTLYTGLHTRYTQRYTHYIYTVLKVTPRITYTKHKVTYTIHRLTHNVQKLHTLYIKLGAVHNNQRVKSDDEGGSR